MIHLNPLKDGKTHLNVHSKARTELGRLLSNFAHTPFTIEEGTFQSVEGYWYWLLSGDDHLKNLYGFEAKRYGRTVAKEDRQVTIEQLLSAYRAKVKQTPGLTELLLANKLPLVHYYVFDGRVRYEARFAWTALLWDTVKSELI